MRHFIRPVIMVCLLLAACGKPGDGVATGPDGPAVPGPTPAQIAFAEAAAPGDAELAAIYERSCKNCHAVINTTAPLTGHRAAWRPRLEARGTAGLLASARNGMKAMPAMGLCADCSDAQFSALIDFMAAEGK